MRFPRIPGFEGIRSSLALLKGNTRTCILFEPMWGIPFVLYNFYLSLYMKELGVSNAQIGYLIAVGYLAGAVFSMFAGAVTDRLGRKRTTLIFDLLAWPLAMLVYLFARGFALFALATVLNSLSRVAAVSYNMLLIEDADNPQRAAAYNFIGIINIASGIFVPLAGIVISLMGLVPGERLFLAVAALSMSAMMLLRHARLTETREGLRIMEEKRREPLLKSAAAALPNRSARALAKRPAALMAVGISVLFNTCLVIGGMTSLYFAPYMTETLALGRSSVSILGGLYSWLLLGIFVWVNPAILRTAKTGIMTAGLSLQAAALLSLTVVPPGRLAPAMLCVAAFSIGFGVFKPFLDSLVAEVTEGKDRAGIYSLLNMLLCLGTSLMGALAGALQSVNPKMVYWLTASVLFLCVLLLASLRRALEAQKQRPAGQAGT